MHSVTSNAVAGAISNIANKVFDRVSVHGNETFSIQLTDLKEYLIFGIRSAFQNAIFLANFHGGYVHTTTLHAQNALVSIQGTGEHDNNTLIINVGNNSYIRIIVYEI